MNCKQIPERQNWKNMISFAATSDEKELIIARHLNIEKQSVLTEIIRIPMIKLDKQASQ